MENPFYTGINIPNAFFCDRQTETASLIQLINNRSNIVLKAPRRIGKSSLIMHVFNQKEIEEKYNTLFVDIYGTTNATEFHAEFQNCLLHAPFAKNARIKSVFDTMVKSAYIDMGGYDGITGAFSFPKIGFTPTTLPKIPMQELFDFLEHTDKPNLIVFDEFQQIQNYPERMAAILRGYIQRLNNCRFIFSGSSRHMLSTMFQVSNQPFYKSAVSMDLDILSLDSYTEFCQRMFGLDHKSIENEAITFAYHLFSGETYLLQELMKDAFTHSSPGDTLTKQDVLKSLERMLASKETDYRAILGRLNNKKESNTLYCIAIEGIASGLTSTAMMKKYDLDNASSVQNALENLGPDRLALIERIGKGIYVIQDRLLELWIASKSGNLEAKYEEAAERFSRQKSIIETVPGL